jgi:Kelch motif
VPIKASHPTFELTTQDFDKALKNLGSVQHRTVMMTSKKICFFGDTNKVMTFDLQTEKWSIKTLSRSSNEFLYYAAAVTLPNGDALITGGGSSTTVYQYLTQKEELVQKRSMNQMRKEHAAVINENFVYVMGGYDGVQNIFLNSCEVYNI